MVNRLESHVSGSVARTNPMEQSPANQAALEGRPNIADTWGGYATRLMDHHDIDPYEAVEALGITREHLADPEVIFTDPNSYRAFMHSRTDAYRDEAKRDLGVEVNRLRDIVDEVMKGYVIDPSEHPTPDEIQAEINEKGERIHQIPEGDEHDRAEVEIDKLVMERDALESGVRITVDEFVATMLATNVLNEEHPSELASVWIGALSDAVKYFWQDYSYMRVDGEEPSLSQLVAGREIFTNFRNFLGDTHKEADAIAKERWAYIEPAFKAPAFTDLPLIAGTEK